MPPKALLILHGVQLMRQVIEFAIPHEHAQERRQIYREDIGDHHRADYVLCEIQLRQHHREDCEIAAVNSWNDDTKLH